MAFEYLEQHNVYTATEMDDILDIMLNEGYDKSFREELKEFMESDDALFAYKGQVRVGDITWQAVFALKSNTKKENIVVYYMESITHTKDIYKCFEKDFDLRKYIRSIDQRILDFIKKHFQK